MRLVSLVEAEVRGQTFEPGRVRRPSSEKARTELGWLPRPVEETILDTARSLKAVGALG